MKPPRLLPILALAAAAGCSDPASDEAWARYKTFTQTLHSGNFDGASAMVAGKAGPGWRSYMERNAGVEQLKTLRYGDASVSQTGRTVHADSVDFTADVTVTLVDKRPAPEVVFVYFLGGGDWFRKHEKRNFRERVTMTRTAGEWKVSDFQVEARE